MQIQTSLKFPKRFMQIARKNPRMGHIRMIRFDYFFELRSSDNFL
jgi:hypothetical protein